jgi:hypothetical protein
MFTFYCTHISIFLPHFLNVSPPPPSHLKKLRSKSVLCIWGKGTNEMHFITRILLQYFQWHPPPSFKTISRQLHVPVSKSFRYTNPSMDPTSIRLTSGSVPPSIQVPVNRCRCCESCNINNAYHYPVALQRSKNRLQRWVAKACCRWY